MTLKEIQRQIDIARAEPINSDGTSRYFDLLPRIYYKDLPAKLKKEADKITVERIKGFLYEFYTVGMLDAIATDQVALNKKIIAALHSARYLVESIDIEPPRPTGNAAVDAANLEAFSPVSLIAIDFIEAWKKITGLTPFAFNSNEAEASKQSNTVVTENLLSNAYAPMFSGGLINDFMQMSTRGAKIDSFSKKATIRTRSGHKFTIERFDKLLKGLTTPAKKLLNTAIIYLTKINYYNTQNVTATVEIPLVEYGEACGYILTPREMPTPAEQEKENEAVQKRIIEFKKDVRRDLHDISSALWTGEETKGRNKGDYAEMRIISSHRIIKGYIRINFDIDAAAYFVQSYVMQHPNALLKIDNRNQNAYVLGYKIAQHNSMDANANRGTNNTLSVKSLLAAAPEIQSIDELKARGQRNWKDKIKRPLEKALDELVTVGVLKKWEYRDPATGNTYNNDGTQSMTWAQYSRLMVDFIVVNAPDQTERRAAKAEAQEKAYKEKVTERKCKKK